MATALSLLQAAEQSWTNLEALSIAGTLRTRLLAFCTAVLPQFPQSLIAGHPVSNWIAVLQAFATDMAATASDWTLLRIAADFLYRTCLMGYEIRTLVAAPTTAMLAAYNAAF